MLSIADQFESPAGKYQEALFSELPVICPRDFMPRIMGLMRAANFSNEISCETKLPDRGAERRRQPLPAGGDFQ
jgi:hypothetical protein